MKTLGLGKTLFNSSVCYLADDRDAEIILTERISRNKSSGAWPAQALEYLTTHYQTDDIPIIENRDVEDPLLVEQSLNSTFPFFESLSQKRLLRFSRVQNKSIQFISHHYAHACAATFMSPFTKALILVIDGAGSKAHLFDKNNPERSLADAVNSSDQMAEERTVYSLDKGRLVCLQKEWQHFKKSSRHPSHYFSEGLGTFYEKISEYIFNSKTSAGKVMGLASFSEPKPISSSLDYLELLDWSKKFNGTSKPEWEASAFMQSYKDCATDVQNYFEQNLLSYAESLKKKFPEYENLILAGGCALNCTTNMKLFKKAIFSNIYIPPFPGDESIGIGAAYSAFLQHIQNWQPFPYETQHGYFGPKKSFPTESSILNEFQNFKISKPESIVAYTSRMLAENKIVAWFQGRSESGPRALGNRSILANPLSTGLKDKLNAKIKFRESFRPYGCSVPFEKSHIYFNVPEGFNNPYMSFAVQVNSDFTSILNEVMHVDGTSRMQTVRKSQNSRFYDLLQHFGEKTGLHCLLNTSLNIMGEPIVETVADAKKFLLNVPVDGLAIGNFYIEKND